MKKRLLIGLSLVLMIVAIVLLGVQVKRPNGTEIHIVRKASDNASTDNSVSADLQSARIDINHASQAELEKLKGVGPAIARRIILERENNGFYYFPEDLLSVYGIGEKTLERIRDSICMKE